MSAYVVNNNTIDVIVRGLEKYRITYSADNYNPTYGVIIDRQKTNSAIGQSLLDYNYKAVNERYKEDTETRKYQFTDIQFNEGMLIGCIDCFEYQACEIKEWFDSNAHFSLQRLKDIIEK